MHKLGDNSPPSMTDNITMKIRKVAQHGSMGKEKKIANGSFLDDRGSLNLGEVKKKL